MNWLARLFGFSPPEDEYGRLTWLREPSQRLPEVSDQQIEASYSQMREAMANETPDEKAAFYTEVSRLLKEQKERPN